MTWMLTSTGLTVELTGGEGNHYSIRDIASSLAMINRFNGHTVRPYSVAEHSLLCTAIATQQQLPPMVKLAALMHDAHEAFVGDVSTPAKQAMGSAWRDFEDRQMHAVRAQYGLNLYFAQYGKTLGHIDLIALATERRDLLEFTPGLSRPWPVLDAPGNEVVPAETDLLSRHRINRHWTTWCEMFIRTYEMLSAEVEDWHIRAGKTVAA